MAIAIGRRRLGVGDILVSGGLLGTLLLTIFLFLNASRTQGYSSEGPGTWAILAMVILSFAYLFAVAAYGFSFIYGMSLLAVAAFGGLQVAQVCFRVFPLSSIPAGLDLLWLMAGTTLLLGSEICRRGITQMGTAGGDPGERAPQGQRPPEARLRQLKQLHESGLLSDSEYADGRKKVLVGLPA